MLSNAIQCPTPFSHSQISPQVFCWTSNTSAIGNHRQRCDNDVTTLPRWSLWQSPNDAPATHHSLLYLLHLPRGKKSSEQLVHFIPPVFPIPRDSIWFYQCLVHLVSISSRFRPDFVQISSRHVQRQFEVQIQALVDLSKLRFTRRSNHRGVSWAAPSTTHAEQPQHHRSTAVAQALRNCAMYTGSSLD